VETGAVSLSSVTRRGLRPACVPVTRRGLRPACVLGRLAATLVAFAAVWGWLSSAAHAEDRRDARWTTILVSAPSCKTGVLSEDAFLRLLEVELLGERIRVTKEEIAVPKELTIEIQRAACDANARDVPIVLRSDNHTPIERSIALADLGTEARPRAFALAVAELIRGARASWKAADQSADAVREVPSPILLIVVSGPEPAEPPTKGPELEGAAAWRMFLPAATSLFGARLATTLPSTVWGLRLRPDASAAWGQASDALGTVLLSSYSAGLAVLASIHDRPVFLFGPHVELGYGHASGTSKGSGSDASGGGMIATTSFLTSSHIAIRRNWSAVVELEGGLTILGFDILADSRSIGGMSGAFAAIRGGVAIAH
jgi:hypothetical protein